jgi:phosphatidylinositol alpha-1,6-mannosyltransferase
MPNCVLALVTDAWGGRGGIAQYNRDFLGAIAPTTALRVLPRHAPDPVTGLPVGAMQAPPRAGRWRYAVAALLDALWHRPDIVFCGHLYMAPLAAVIARLCKAKLIVQAHGIEAWPRPSRAVRWATERADLVLAVSRYTRAQVLSWAAIEPERVSVLPNTVSGCFTPGDRREARRRFEIGDQRVLLTVGRLAASERYKGHDRVIKALPALVAAGHDVLYLIAGDGDDRPRLEALARSAGVSNRVRFLGAVGGDDLPDLYRAADVFVMPSTGEGFGIAYLEAMACGTPAVGLAVKGDRDALSPMQGSGLVGGGALRRAAADGAASKSGAPECSRTDGTDWLGATLALLSTVPDPARLGQYVQSVGARFAVPVFRRRAASLMDQVAPAGVPQSDGR